MTNQTSKMRQLSLWLWGHVSVSVALVLIFLSLFVGYRMGKHGSADKADSGSAENAHHEAPLSVPEYTCSMHPAVRTTDPAAKCPICFMALVPVTDYGQSSSQTQLALSESAAAISGIETHSVSRFFPQAQVRLYGKVTYDETSLARLSAYFPGRIERLFVNYVGIPVSEGDHIANVYSPELLAAFEELRQAARSSSGSSNMSDLVRASSQDMLTASREKLRLYGLTPEQIAAVESGEHISDSLTIYAPIGGIVTHLAVRDGDYIEEGSPIATVADLSRLWLDLEAYESQLSLLRWGQPVEFSVEANPGVVFTGHISFIEPLVDDRTRTASVRVAVSNTDGLLKPGMFASAVVRPQVSLSGAIPDDDLKNKWVGPMHPTIVRDEPGECEVCGMELVPAESLVVTTDPELTTEPIAIPASAVLFTGTRSVVYVEVPDASSPTYEGREVRLGTRAGEHYIIREGLRVGERIVTNGAFRIDSEMQIQAKPSMMSPHEGGLIEREGHSHGSSAPSSDDPRSAERLEFVRSLSSLYSSYFDAQEALAGDDLGEFVASASDLHESFQRVSTATLGAEDREVWDRYAQQLSMPETFPDIDEARQSFETLSRGMISLHQQFGHLSDGTWHVAYCPMAFDNTGAQWLQRRPELINPYYGAAMLRCGEFREEHPPLDLSSTAASDPGDGDE